MSFFEWNHRPGRVLPREFSIICVWRPRKKCDSKSPRVSLKQLSSSPGFHRVLFLLSSHEMREGFRQHVNINHFSLGEDTSPVTGWWIRPFSRILAPPPFLALSFDNAESLENSSQVRFSVTKVFFTIIFWPAETMHLEETFIFSFPEGLLVGSRQSWDCEVNCHAGQVLNIPEWGSRVGSAFGHNSHSWTGWIHLSQEEICVLPTRGVEFTVAPGSWCYHKIFKGHRIHQVLAGQETIPHHLSGGFRRKYQKHL